MTLSVLSAVSARICLPQNNPKENLNANKQGTFSLFGEKVPFAFQIKFSVNVFFAEFFRSVCFKSVAVCVYKEVKGDFADYKAYNHGCHADIRLKCLLKPCNINLEILDGAEDYEVYEVIRHHHEFENRRSFGCKNQHQTKHQIKHINGNLPKVVEGICVAAEQRTVNINGKCRQSYGSVHNNGGQKNFKNYTKPAPHFIKESRNQSIHFSNFTSATNYNLRGKFFQPLGN